MTFEGYNIRVTLTYNVLQTLRRFEQRNIKNESGGILLGKVYQDIILMEKVTVPGLHDKFGRYFYIRSKKNAQRVINKLWKSSNGKTIYLGEWHTHPIVNPKPSLQDLKMIKECLISTKMEIDFLILIIVGLSGSLWVGIQTNDSLIELSLSEVNSAQHSKFIQ